MLVKRLFGLGAAAVLFCAGLTTTTRGQDAPRVESITAAVRPFVSDNEIAGAVTLVATRQGIAHLDVIGKSDIEKDQPMRADSIFWIASMTKPITGTAVAMLQEEGKLSVEDPISKYIPELAQLKTRDGKTPTITIRHLLTHSSGMGEISGQEARQCATLKQAVALYAAKPLNFEPGSKWAYCQSGINTAARIVEVVSGKNFADFVQERLFTPLGMKDTTFYLDDQQLGRLATAYRRTGDGKLEPGPIGFLNGQSPASRDRFPAGNGGLFSTAPDYARFCRMVLNNGSLDGRQYLKPETVRFMTGVLSGDLKTGFTPGNGWGLAWCIVRQPQGVTAMLSPGSFGHGGAYGTQAWIDPTRGRAYILMVQRSNFPNSDDSPVRKAFQEAAAKSL